MGIQEDIADAMGNSASKYEKQQKKVSGKAKNRNYKCSKHRKFSYSL